VKARIFKDRFQKEEFKDGEKNQGIKKYWGGANSLLFRSSL
jgi:hypothetical protein